MAFRLGAPGAMVLKMKSSPSLVFVALIAAASIGVVSPAFAQTAPAKASPAAPAPTPGKKVIEIYRIAPGQHLAFLQAIAKYDEANRMAGLPPRELYVHSDGADWDFLLIQPAETPPDKAAALDAAWDKLGLPSGADFFLEFRKFIADHTDTFVKGPTTAADFLATRKEH
jgi:hypothetical protein